MTHEYDDIINLPHHVSRHHQQMSMEARAAQFAPFAALTGHSAAIQETARLTSDQVMLDDNSNEELNRKMLLLKSIIGENPFVTITYFQPDQKKDGGAYQVFEGHIKKIDDFAQRINLDNGKSIAFQHILDIDIKEQNTDNE